MKNTAEYLAKRIEDLGYTLVVRHYRYDKRTDSPNYFKDLASKRNHMKYKRGSHVIPQALDSSNFSCRGGCTLATVYDADGWTVCVAKAICSTEDNFNKSIGWIKAVGRVYGKIPSVYHVPFRFGETITK